MGVSFFVAVAGLLGRVASASAGSESSVGEYKLDPGRATLLRNRRKPVRFDVDAVRRAPAAFQQAVRGTARAVAEEHAAASAARGYPVGAAELGHLSTSRVAGQLLPYVNAFECACPYEAADCASLTRFQDFLSGGTDYGTNVILSDGALVGIPFGDLNPNQEGATVCADFLVANAYSYSYGSWSSYSFSYSREGTAVGFDSCDSALKTMVDVCQDFPLGEDDDAGLMDDAVLWAQIEAIFLKATGYATEDLDDDVVASLDSAAEWVCAYTLIQFFACLEPEEGGAPCGGGPELCDAVCTGDTPYGQDLRSRGLTFCDAINLGDELNETFQYCCAQKYEVSPPVTCGDSATWSKKGEPDKNCDWVATLPGARCLVKDGDAVYAAEACLAACGACGEACVDSASWHKAGEPDKDCVWVSRLPNRLAVTGEDSRRAYEACRAATRSCDYHAGGGGGGGTSCGDSASWFKKDEPDKNCEWVAKLPEARCRVKDGAAVYAAEACLTACGGCDRPCADSASWFKAGDPTKDCLWASRLANRVPVKGDDGTDAYVACPLAFRACAGFGA